MESANFACGETSAYWNVPHRWPVSCPFPGVYGGDLKSSSVTIISITRVTYLAKVDMTDATCLYNNPY